MKRVWNLYRVSTDRQHNGDDIPMQRIACNDFIKTKKDWKLEHEVYEMGVSGYKLSSKERDEIEIIMKAAERKEFDVLLVFMFDRLGRREDDTPFIVQTLVRLGIEVWSVKEGERKFEQHVDKLINYITFWQASGESDKTSKRVTEILGQMNNAGEFTGGTPPYGYEVYDTGIPHPKYEKTVKNLRVYEPEAEMVRKMFDLVIVKGYGAPRIASWLNEIKYKTRNGKPWRHNYVQRILRNHIYIGHKQYGYFASGSIDMSKLKLQPFRQEYVILEKDKFQLVQMILDKRSGNNEAYEDALEGNNINAQVVPTKSSLLLSGIAECGYCGAKLKADHSIKTYKRKSDGVITKMKTLRYVCGKGKDKTISHDAVQFGAKKYEAEIIEAIKAELDKVDITQFSKERNKQINKELALKENALKECQKSLKVAFDEKKAIESLIIRIELGKSRLSIDDTESMLIEQNEKIQKIKTDIESLEKSINDESNIKGMYNQVEAEIENWSEKFDQADLDSQKMMISRVVQKVIIKKDFVQVELIEPLQVNYGRIACPNGNGTGGPGYEIKCEINPNKHERGALAMAHRGPNTGGSQFYITYAPQPHLDGVHTVFGKVISGMEHVDKFQGRDRMESIRVSEAG